MDIERLRSVLSKIHGATFASIDAVTKPAPGLRKVVLGERVLLFNTGVSGYERMVKRRLIQEGLDPDGFTVGPLPWGNRVAGSPSCLLTLRDEYYLQTIQLAPGKETYHTLSGQEISAESAKAFLPASRLFSGSNQGLPVDRKISVHTYHVKSLTGIRLLGEKLA